MKVLKYLKTYCTTVEAVMISFAVVVIQETM